jgi:hypothetical protein
MSKISNTSAYGNITPTAADYIVLTEADNYLATKTSTLGEVQSLFGIDTLVAHVAVNSASLLTLSTTAATLITAPGAGKVLDILSIMAYMDAGAVAYNFTPALPVTIGAESIATFSNARVNSAIDVVFKPEVPQSNEVIAQNTGLTLTAGGSNPTQGTGILYVNIYYRVLTVGSSF